MSRPSDPTRTSRQQAEPTPLGPSACHAVLSILLEENGFRFCRAVLVSFSARSVPTRASSTAYTWFEMGYRGRWGTQLFDGFALGCKHLTPHPVLERPGAEQTGPDPAGMAFASSQRAPPTHTPPMWGQPALCLSWRDLWTEGRWEGLGVRQKSGIAVLGGPRRETGCFVSTFLELPSFA